MEPRALLHAMFMAAVRSADPAHCLAEHLPAPPKGRTVVIGAGKAAAAMARAVEQAWPGPLEGLVVTRYGHDVPCKHIEVATAGHPVPDDAGLAATTRLLSCVRGLGPEDLVLALLSGGGSALLVQPAPGVALADKQAIARTLLASGATIAEINCVRRHLSSVKGGRLALACQPARLVTLAISDVPGDHPSDIASGPTVADPTTRADAQAVLARHRVPVPASVQAWLAQTASETPKPADAAFSASDYRLIATPHGALAAAAQVARSAGYATHILSDALEGESREVGTVLAALARHVARRGEPFAAPCVLLSGGETSVTVRGDGRGGRNVEFALSLALGLQGEPGVHALAADTDGVDGVDELAGAMVTPDTLERARRLGLDPRRALDRNDGHGFFHALGDSVVTGPTLTNVNDFRAIVIGTSA